MRVKHYKLLASVAMLISLLTLPNNIVVVKATEQKPVIEAVSVGVCKADYEADPLADKKANVHRHLKYVYRVDPNQIDWWTYYIADSSSRYNVPEEKMIAMLAVESRFNPFPKRNGGSIGPSQVQGKYWKKNGRYDIYKPDENIYLGAKILRSYRDQCGNWDCALRGYNVGINAYLRGDSKVKQSSYIKMIERHLVMIQNNKKRA